MKYLLILLSLIFVGCSYEVDQYGVTDTVTISNVVSKEDAVELLMSKLKLVCRKHGYNRVELIHSKLRTNGYRFSISGNGQCLKKPKYDEGY